MMKSLTVQCFLALLITLAGAGLYACAHSPSAPARHPAPVEPAQLCSECHQDWRSALNHTPDFNRRHRFYAYQKQGTCSLCHPASFCSDCHAHKEELKPSEKYKEYVTRDLPHRGDYLVQHQIDGRIYPSSCVKCHGRQNNERCRVCHR